MGQQVHYCQINGKPTTMHRKQIMKYPEGKCPFCNTIVREWSEE